MIINRYDVEKHLEWRDYCQLANFMNKLTRFSPPIQKMIERKEPKYYNTVLRGINHYDTEKLKESIVNKINEPSSAKEIHRKAWRATLQKIIDIEKSIEENGR